MTEEDKAFQAWSNGIAELIADAMIDADLIDKEKFEKSVDVIGLEIFVRLISGDYPPNLKHKLLPSEQK